MRGTSSSSWRAGTVSPWASVFSPSKGLRTNGRPATSSLWFVVPTRGVGLTRKMTSFQGQKFLPPTLRDIYAGTARVGDVIQLQGWVRTVRNQKQNCFIELSDGTHQLPLQVVATPEIAAKLTTGCSIGVSGMLVNSPGTQNIELAAESINIIGTCDADQYPLAKKRHSFEFLRELPHLRPRTNTFGAVMRVRHAAATAIRRFFDDNGFIEVNTPVLTSNDCEGAGEQFKVVDNSLSTTAQKPAASSATQPSNQFFGTEVSLTVSGQLHAEAMASALSRVYTFGPTFRADNSNTRNHLAEFWMIEPEMAFAGLEENIILAEQMVKCAIDHILTKCPDEMRFFQERIDETLDKRLRKALDDSFKVITYNEAVHTLQQHISKELVKFEFGVEWGCDLQKEHERYIVEKVFDNRPVFIINYPKAIKPFYMKENTDEKETGKKRRGPGSDKPTVQAMDLLVPNVGELIGGSVREENMNVLLERMRALNMSTKEYGWYLDLRRFGSVPHCGFGMGFERFVQYVTGMSSIRDVIPVPRYPGSCLF